MVKGKRPKITLSKNTISYINVKKSLYKWGQNGGKGEVMSILESYRREVGHLTEENALDTDFSKPKIDEEAREIAKERASRYRGSVRIANGLFYTDEEREKTREELLKVKLP